MIVERGWSQALIRGKGEEGEAEEARVLMGRRAGKLVNKLVAVRALNASDDRDRVYALMGLAVDGEDECGQILCVMYWERLRGLFTRGL